MKNNIFDLKKRKKHKKLFFSSNFDFRSINKSSQNIEFLMENFFSHFKFLEDRMERWREKVDNF